MCGRNSYCMDMPTVPDWLPALTLRERPLYLALVDRLAEDIRKNRLRPGARLPTHRRLAAALGIDVTTVSRAYAEARKRGLVAGHVGRGTYVRGAVAGQSNGPRDVVDLTVNIPPEDNALVTRVAAWAFDRLVRSGAQAAGYAPIGGRPEDRATAAEWLARHGLHVRADRVLVAACGQQAFVAILSAHCEPGDVVLTEHTTYPGFVAAAQLLRLTVVGADSDRDGIDPASVERLCRRHRPKVLMVVPTLQNPTGVTMTAGRRTRLAAVAHKHGLVILEDDAYGPLHRTPPRPVADIAPTLTYLVATASKVLMPMMRWCAIAAPSPALARRVESALRSIGWMQSALECDLARNILESGKADAVLTARREDAQSRMAVAIRLLGAAASRSRAMTASGHHLWLELPRRWDARSFVAACHQRGVLVSPGDAFAIDASRTIRAVRICLGAAKSPNQLEAALRIVADTMHGDPADASPSH